MFRERIEFYWENDLTPDVVLVEDYLTRETTPEDRLRVLDAELAGCPKDNPALVALEYVMEFTKPGVCVILPGKAGEARPGAWRVRCFRTHLTWDRGRVGRKVA